MPSCSFAPETRGQRQCSETGDRTGNQEPEVQPFRPSTQNLWAPLLVADISGNSSASDDAGIAARDAPRSDAAQTDQLSLPCDLELDVQDEMQVLNEFFTHLNVQSPPCSPMQAGARASTSVEDDCQPDAHQAASSHEAGNSAHVAAQGCTPRATAQQPIPHDVVLKNPRWREAFLSPSKADISGDGDSNASAVVPPVASELLASVTVPHEDYDNTVGSPGVLPATQLPMHDDSLLPNMSTFIRGPDEVLSSANAQVDASAQCAGSEVIELAPDCGIQEDRAQNVGGVVANEKHERMGRFASQCPEEGCAGRIQRFVAQDLETGSVLRNEESNVCTSDEVGDRTSSHSSVYATGHPSRAELDAPAEPSTTLDKAIDTHDPEHTCPLRIEHPSTIAVPVQREVEDKIMDSAIADGSSQATPTSHNDDHFQACRPARTPCLTSNASLVTASTGLEGVAETASGVQVTTFSQRLERPTRHALQLVALQARAEEEAWRFCEAEARKRAGEACERMEMMRSMLRDTAEVSSVSDEPYAEWVVGPLVPGLEGDELPDEKMRAALRRADEVQRRAVHEKADQAALEASICLEERLQQAQLDRDEQREFAEEATSRERQLEELVAYSRDVQEKVERHRDLESRQALQETEMCRRLQLELEERREQAITHEAEMAAQLQMADQLRAKRRKSSSWCLMGSRSRNRAPIDVDIQMALEHAAAEVGRQQLAARQREQEGNRPGAEMLRELDAAKEEQAVMRSEIEEMRSLLHSQAELAVATAARETEPNAESSASNATGDLDSAPPQLSAASAAIAVDQAADALQNSRAAAPVGEGTAIVVEVPLAVRIPRFEMQGLLTSKVNYTIVLEGPGTTVSVVKSYTEFRELHTALKNKPFGHTLQSPPLDWLFAVFSSALLERRRRQLETYLASLCTHAGVLRDSTIWEWLEIDALTRVMVRLVVAHATRDNVEVGQLVRTLARSVASGDQTQAARCVHPAVLSVLGNLLRSLPHEAPDSATLGHVCQLLGRLLPRHRRARQLFLAAPIDGVSTLMGAATFATGAAADEARNVLKAVLQSLVEVDDEVDSGRRNPQPATTSSGNNASDTVSQGGLGECCVCMDRGKSHALLPCGHLCVCMGCADFLAARATGGATGGGSSHGCPVCRRQIERVVQIFV